MYGKCYASCLALLLICSFPFLLSAQPIFQRDYTFGAGQPVAVESMGNRLYVAGTSASQTLGGLDVCLMKTHPDGAPIWSKVFGSANDDRLMSMCRTQDGRLALIGSTTGFGAVGDPGNVYALVLDTSGAALHTQCINLGGRDAGHSIRETSDGGFIIAATSFDGNFPQAHLIKVGTDLQLQWSRKYTNTINPGHYARAAVETSNGGYALVGDGRPGYPPNDTEAYVLVTDHAGQVLANRHFQNTSSALSDFGVRGNDIITNAAGQLVMAGSIGGYFTQGGYDRYAHMVVVLDLNAEHVLSRRYCLSCGDSDVHSIRQTPDGGYIFGGTYWGGQPFLEKIDSTLEKEWAYILSNQFLGVADKGSTVRNAPGGGFVLSGPLTSTDELRLIRTDGLGQSSCPTTAPSGNGLAYPLLPQTYTLTWSSTTAGNTVQASTLSQPLPLNATVICASVGTTPAVHAPLLQLGPNPAGDRVVVETSGADQLIVTNLLGETVFSSPMQALGTTRLTLDIADWAAGLYLVRAGSTTQKLIKE